MGQKVNPIGIRLGIVRDWNSTWYADSRKFSDYLISDINVRKYLRDKYTGAGVSAIQIGRLAKNATVKIHAARPGVILGKKGGDVDVLRNVLTKMMGVPVLVNVAEVKKPDLDAKLVADGIAQQLERRIMFRKAMKRCVQSTMKSGALGIKISVSGRLGGAEIARTEWVREGRVPLHTFRADIDYGLAEAKTTYGIIGVKVWIFRGEVFAKEDKSSVEVAANEATE